MVSKFELSETQFEITVRDETKSLAKSSWSEKMIVSSTFLGFAVNFLFNNLKKHHKIWYSQGEKRCQSLNCQKHSLKRQSGTKPPVKLLLWEN